MTRAELTARLTASLDVVDEAIRRVSATANAAGIPPLAMVYPSGEHALTPLLAAQAQLLVSLALLEVLP